MNRSEFNANSALAASANGRAALVTIRDNSPVSIAFADTRDNCARHREFYAARGVVRDAERIARHNAQPRAGFLRLFWAAK